MDIQIEKRLILRLHEHHGEGVTLYKTSSFPMELQDQLAHQSLVAVYPLKEQRLERGLLTLGLMQEVKTNIYTELEKVYAAFPAKFEEDIKILLPIIEQLSIDTKTSLTTRQRTAVNLMITGIFWGIHSEIVAPIILV